MHADGAAEICDLVVIGEDGAAVTVAAQRLGREEGGGSHLAESAALLALVGSAEALCAVLNEDETVLLADGDDSVIVAGVAQNVHGHHSLGGQLALSQHSLDLALQTFGAQGVGVGGDVAEHGGRAKHLGRLGGGDKGHIGAEHRVTLAHTGDHKSNLQRIGAVGAGDAVLAANKGGQLLLQLLHLRTADKLSGIQHGLDVGVDLFLQSRILGLQINKLHCVILLSLQTVWRDCLPPSDYFQHF